MSVLDREWKSTLPTLAEIDADITRVEAQLQQLRALRQGVELILSATNGTAMLHMLDVPISREGTSPTDFGNLSAKERLIRVLQDAGRPLKWSELQERVSRGPNPPTPGTIASAYYHNTKAGSQSFVPLPGGYAGLAGRDEGWEPEEGGDSSKVSGEPTLRDLVAEFISEHREFTLAEVLAAVRAVRPDALAHTIRGHLSYAKKHGEIDNVGRGLWRRSPRPEDDEEEEEALELRPQRRAVFRL